MNIIKTFFQFAILLSVISVTASYCLKEQKSHTLYTDMGGKRQYILDESVEPACFTCMWENTPDIKNKFTFSNLIPDPSVPDSVVSVAIDLDATDKLIYGPKGLDSVRVELYSKEGSYIKLTTTKSCYELLVSKLPNDERER